ncbi:hypothetical protein M513_12726 [Trichuris suis]|uniref:RING-type E3 ubiquitin transferase n=1 Tax=Trichuris suis TaxID=68888 RepID=A0A085LN45_9BILA|nr:hypothetical protein M513_12726 [Trichuris suis]
MPSMNAEQVALNVRRSLKDQFTCPICLDTLKRTVVSKECLHRFCRERIGRALRTGKRERPSCRAYLPSKRSLLPDSTFDDIIRVMSACQQPAAEMNASEAETCAIFSLIRFNR